MKKEKTYYYEIDKKTINTFPIVLYIIMIVITFGLNKIFNLNLKMTESNFFMSLVILIPYFMFHEVLHSIGYIVHGAKFKYITYGIHLEKGVLCCSCKQEVPKKCILFSLMYPFVIIGIITYILGLVLHSFPLVLLSIANIGGCAGDLCMFYNFLKIKDFKFFEYDNPIAFGIKTTEDLDNKKLSGLKKYEEKNMTQTIDKKISISKTSIIFLTVYFLLLLIDLLLL